MPAIKHALADRGADLYETPSEAVEALLEHEPLPAIVWEPACGRSAISRVLRAAGKDVYESDVMEYGDHVVRSFFEFDHAPKGIDCVVTNPPFSFAEQFVRRSRAMVKKTCMLLRLAFLESERRRDILESGDLARVYVFRNRLPMMHRDGWDGPRATSTTAYAWYVWDREHTGPAEIRRISWARGTNGRQGRFRGQPRCF